MYTITIIEDDKTIRNELHLVLSNNGYKVNNITQFDHVAEQIKDLNPHIILMDINLPGEDGHSICMKVRSFSQVPIIFVTSRDRDMDELQSLMIGGDDFITKPYNISILLTRIALILKRVYKDESQFILKHKNVILLIEAGKIECDGQTVELTKCELRILIYFFKHIGKIVTRGEIIDDLWDNDMFVDDNTLSVNITRIRSKLKLIQVNNLIETKHRQGYYME